MHEHDSQTSRRFNIHKMRAPKSNVGYSTKKNFQDL